MGVGFSYHRSLPTAHMLQHVLCTRADTSDMASCALGGRTCSCLHFTDGVTEAEKWHLPRSTVIVEESGFMSLYCLGLQFAFVTKECALHQYLANHEQ